MFHSYGLSIHSLIYLCNCLHMFASCNVICTCVIIIHLYVYIYIYLNVYIKDLQHIDLQLSNFMTPATCSPPKTSQHPLAIWHKECDQSCGLAEQIQERSVSCQAIYGGELLMLGQLGWAAKAQGPRPKVFRFCGYSVATGRSWWSRKISMNQQSC